MEGVSGESHQPCPIVAGFFYRGKMGKAFVFLNGEMDIDSEICRSMVSEEDYVFCADGGSRYAMAIGVIPTLVMGDMDSIDSETRMWLDRNNVEVFTFPAEKDSSDTELLLDYICNSGVRDITLFAATGGRIDHQLANLLLLEKYTLEGHSIRILYAKGVVEGVRGQSKIVLIGKRGYLSSIFTVSDSALVSLEGFRYELSITEVRRDSTLGLSNVIESNNAMVTVHSGNILLFVQEGNEE
jgi:thiamine pyrophosphokinase